MKVHRTKHTEHFTILPNAALRDERLSYRARGVLMELLSRPEDWQATADSLSRTAKKQRGKKGEGRDAMRGAFAELKAAGYIVATKGEGESGTHTTELHVYDVAQDVTSEDVQNPRSDRGTENQASVNQASADQSSENQASLERTGDGSTDTKDCSTKDSSSSAPVTPAPEPAPAPEKKTKKTPEQIITDKLTSPEARPQGGPPTPEEATAIKRRVISQAAADGVRIRSTEGYLSGRDVVLLEQDLAAVRGLQASADNVRSIDEGERIRRMQKGAYKPYQNPQDQSVYDEPLLPAPKPKRRAGVVGGSRVEVLPNEAYSAMTDDEVRAAFLG